MNFACIFVLSSKAIYCSLFCCYWHTLEVKKWNVVTYFHPNNLLHLFNNNLPPFLRNSCKMLEYTADSEDKKAENVLLWRNTNAFQSCSDLYKLHLTICACEGELSYKIHKELMLLKYFQQNLCHIKMFHV